MALWPVALSAAQTGRTHGRTNQRCRGAQKPETSADAIALIDEDQHDPAWRIDKVARRRQRIELEGGLRLDVNKLDDSINAFVGLG
jgi:hypothetical protein